MGLACLVFPGANHTRYEHSLGTMLVARRLVGALVNKTQSSFVEKKAKTIKFAALLHDLGHSPFSHVTEEFFQKNPNYLPNSGLNYDHEKYTEEIIRHNKSIRKICRKERINARFLSKLAIGKSGTFLDGLLSSATDVDKIDYVTRDSYFCGLPYGRIDLSALEDGITITKGTSGNEVIAFGNECRDVLEGLLMSRFYLASIIHVNERNCAANQILLKGIRKAYDAVLDVAEPEHLGTEVKTLILESLHFLWVDHDLVTFLQDPLQRLKFAAIEAIRQKVSSLNEDTLRKISELRSPKPAKRYYSYVLLNRVLRGAIPKLRFNIPLMTLPPSAKYGLYVLYSLSPYTNHLNDFKRSVQRLRPCKGKVIYVDISSPKTLEINAKIIMEKKQIKTLYDISFLMRSLDSETRNRMALRIFSNKPIEGISIPELEELIKVFSQRARKKAVKKKQYLGSDLLLLVYYHLHSEERLFFEGDTRFQALFSVLLDKIVGESENPYRELARLPRKFGDLRQWFNYDKFIQKAYPEFFSVKTVQDLAALTEMGLIYTRSGPILLVSEYLYPTRNERRISYYGREYVENNLLKTYPFSNKILEQIKKIKDSESTLIRLGT